MNLKISSIIKLGIGIILFIFSLFCFLLNYYITIPLGIISLFSAIIISPLFELICKKLNKKFTLLQKLTLIYGIVMITYISMLLNDLSYYFSLYFLDTIEKSFYLAINFLLILFYVILFVFFNKHKFNEKIIISRKKRIILIIISILLINLPLNIIKIYFLNNYYKQIEYISPYKILEDIDVNSYKNVNNITNFDKLLYRNDFQDYELITNNEHTKTYKKDNLGIIISKDFMSPIYMGINNESLAYTHFYKLYNISSLGAFYEFYNNHKNLSLFDNIYEIVFTSFNYLVLTNDTESYQKINLDNDLKVFILSSNSSKHSEIIVENKDNAYTITFIDIDGKITKDYLMDFIKTLTIE